MQAIKKITIHPVCNYTSGERFHIRAMIDDAKAREIAIKVQIAFEETVGDGHMWDKTAACFGTQIEITDGCADETSGCQHFIMDDIGVLLTWDTNGNSRLDLSCPKEFEGDDRLDGTIDYSTLPESFWIAPAALLKAVLA